MCIRDSVYNDLQAKQTLAIDWIHLFCRSSVGVHLSQFQQGLHVAVVLFTIMMVPGIIATLEPIDIESYDMESPELDANLVLREEFTAAGNIWGFGVFVRDPSFFGESGSDVDMIAELKLAGFENILTSFLVGAPGYPHLVGTLPALFALTGHKKAPVREAAEGVAKELMTALPGDSLRVMKKAIFDATDRERAWQTRVFALTGCDYCARLAARPDATGVLFPAEASEETAKEATEEGPGPTGRSSRTWSAWPGRVVFNATAGSGSSSATASSIDGAA